MTTIKTQPTKESVTTFLRSVAPKEKQIDSLALLKLFKEITGEKPIMWGTSIIGFGRYHYKSEKSRRRVTGFTLAFHHANKI